MQADKNYKFREHKISETDIVSRILLGEKELFEILLRRNNQKLYRVIRSYINDMAEIEDIMQNTYLKAFEKLYQFKHASQFSTWLIKIGINETLSRLKVRSKIFNLYDQSIDFENKTVLQMPDKEQLNPERKIIRQEAKQILENVIDTLSPKYKTVYILREIEGMSIAEISDCLDLSKSNVKVRLHRAKLMVKKELYELVQSNDVFEFGFDRCDRMVEIVLKRII